VPNTRTPLVEIAQARTDLSEEEISHLQLLLADWTLIADLAFADLILWLPTWNEAGFVAAAQIRPTTARTHIPEDLVGRFVPRGRHAELDRAFATTQITQGAGSPAHDVTQAIPVKCANRTIAIIGCYAEVTQSGRLENVYAACAVELFEMVSSGEFPRQTGNDQGTGGRGGAPRVGDGLMLLDEHGVIEFASPNARSAFRRLGLAIDIEGQVLAELAARLNRRGVPIDDTLSLVARGRIQGTAEIEGAQSAATVRSIPLQGRKTIILIRDVSDLRRREQALVGKDAAIREIHHRVKNNLQTVASLLRIQGRRLNDTSAQSAIAEAGRRVATIAVVHDLLAHNPGEMVDFDEVASKVVTLTMETAVPIKVDLHSEMQFGLLSSDQATPLALVIAEVVANALEHGQEPGGTASIHIGAVRTAEEVTVIVSDSGMGISLPLDTSGGLGLEIVQTLVNDELSGEIDFAHENERFSQGTRVTIRIPLNEGFAIS
jgi:two-component sensor histidine kinase